MTDAEIRAGLEEMRGLQVSHDGHFFACDCCRCAGRAKNIAVLDAALQRLSREAPADVQETIRGLEVIASRYEDLQRSESTGSRAWHILQAHLDSLDRALTLLRQRRDEGADDLTELLARDANQSLNDYLRGYKDGMEKRVEPPAAPDVQDIERRRLAAYRQARVFEPSMEAYNAAMSVYAAAFGKPDGEPTVVHEQHEVVINLPHDMTGHIVFTPQQARALADSLNRKARDAERAHRDALEDERRKNAPPVDRSKLCTTDGRSVADARASQTNETGQHASYIVLCDEERAKGFVRPYRDSYRHVGGCGTVTTMGRALSETYARDPAFYGATFCCGCNRHLPVSEFVWTADGQPVGS